jgi:hypothetical protein
VIVWLFGSRSPDVGGLSATKGVAKPVTLQEEVGSMLAALLDLFRLALNHNQTGLR